jgi:hypothetical protein
MKIMFLASKFQIFMKKHDLRFFKSVLYFVLPTVVIRGSSQVGIRVTLRQLIIRNYIKRWHLDSSVSTFSIVFE